jgi:hypothetical protein
MSDNITLVKIVDTPDEPTRLVVIFVAVIIIIGLLIATIKTSESTVANKQTGIIQLFKIKRFRRFLGLGLTLFAIMVLFTESSSLREPLVALSAVIATIISLISLNESSSIKKESLARESKEKHRQNLKELLDWAVQTMKYVTIPGRPSQDLQEIANNLLECRNELIVQKAKSIIIYAKINDIPNSIDPNIAILKVALTDLSRSVIIFGDSLSVFRANTGTTEQLYEIINKAGDLTSKLRILLETISKIDL